ncbi:sodium- and chloride-dependent glycine transporter 1-like isoform X2 [Liolophura sinensis]|uniref:sodium- and chloride-dependent glycine transporter 1-like isoform X2 n=1 Tax=Liolophura sinensis TaxID=3198878 RepID=UPI0031597DF0
MDRLRQKFRQVTGRHNGKVVPEGTSQTQQRLERGNWGNKLEFILTCVGYSVGLGNVWRFPYLAFKNGGGIGFSMVITLALVATYYNVIIGYCFFYFFASMTDRLPWAHCDNVWNSPNCVVGNETLASGEQAISSSEDFFTRYVLDQSPTIDEIGTPRWQLVLCLMLAWTVVFVVLVRGIKSLGKVVYFTATFPYLLLLALLIRGATLEGSADGIYYYLTPRWDRLDDSSVWSDATTQVFYSLSACSGGLIMMSSFNKFSNNCLRDALIVPLIDCLTSFFSGFVIFTVLGFMAHAKGAKVEDVAADGPGLAFVAYPEAIANMPYPVVWAVLFFFMMLIIGFSSQFSIIETLVSSVSDEYDFILRKNWRVSMLFRVSICCALFLLALPMTTQGGIYLLTLIDTFVSGFPLLFVGLFECFALCYIYGYKNFAADIKMMLGREPFIYWRICWCFITPGLLFAVIVFKAIEYTPASYGDDYVFPNWAQALGWLICLFPVMAMPGWFLFYYCRNGGWKVAFKVSRALPVWGPALTENRIKDPRYTCSSTAPGSSDVPQDSDGGVTGDGTVANMKKEPNIPVQNGVSSIQCEESAANQ